MGIAESSNRVLQVLQVLWVLEVLQVLQVLKTRGSFGFSTFLREGGHSGSVGCRIAITLKVIAQHFTQLVTWQLADRLRREVYRLTSDGTASRDFRFKDDIRSAASSVANNTAEGFGRFRPREFHRFLEIAKGSLAETENHLVDGQARGYFAESDVVKARTLVKRTGVAMSR